MKIILDTFMFALLCGGSFYVGAMFATKYIHKVFKHVANNDDYGKADS